MLLYIRQKRLFVGSHLLISLSMENKKEGLNKPDAGISSPINLSAM